MRPLARAMVRCAGVPIAHMHLCCCLCAQHAGFHHASRRAVCHRWRGVRHAGEGARAALRQAGEPQTGLQLTLPRLRWQENCAVGSPCGLSPVRGKRPRRGAARAARLPASGTGRYGHTAGRHLAPRVSDTPCRILRAVEGELLEEDVSQASQGGEAAGRPPRHGGTPFALTSRGLAPPFAAASAAAERRARLLALKRSTASPPSHKNAFTSAADSDADATPAPCDGLGSACTSRYRADFKQLRALGRGNFSSVFEVRGRLDGCRYAVKRSARELHTAAQQRAALTEVQALAAAGPHPHLVRYFSAWFEGDRLHIQLELCGAPLAARIAARQPLGARDVASVLRCVAGALAHMHAAGIAHMDVKPDNIFLASPDGPEPDGSGACSYTLGDLGTACALRNAGTGPANVTEGDARYVPAEVLNGFYGALDRADVFALGVSAYELARGEPLPREGDAYAALRQGEVPDVPGLPEALQQLMRRCMSAFPAQRPAASVLAASPALHEADGAAAMSD